MTATLSGLTRLPQREAALDRLPEALRALWQAACTDHGDVARALTVNFVAVAAADSPGALREQADCLMRRSPARAFLITIDDTLREPTAAVAAVTRGNGKVRDVVLEEITLRMPRRWFPHVPGLLRPLLINDLPNHLFWADDWHGAADFDALLRLCGRAVVDSRRFGLPAVQLPDLERRRNDGHRITDLSWLRLRPWRRALAEAFERVSWQPDTAVTGEIRHGPFATAAAILLGQWLESRLGARLALEASDTADSVCPDEICLRFAGIAIEVAAVDRRLVVQVTTPAQCYLPFRVPRSSASDGDLLAAAIDIA